MDFGDDGDQDRTQAELDTTNQPTAEATLFNQNRTSSSLHSSSNNDDGSLILKNDEEE